MTQTDNSTGVQFENGFLKQFQFKGLNFKP